MRFFILAAVILVFSLPLARATSAADGKVVECGKAVSGDIPTDPGIDFCDIFSRQLEYSESRRKFSAQLRERQKNFIAPRIEAARNYENNLHAARGWETEEEYMDEELYGPFEE